MSFRTGGPALRFALVSALASVAAFSGALQVGCASSADAPVPVAEGSDAIVTLPASPVKNQSNGNCWAYAIAGWSESLHKAKTGANINLSESYWTYWRWFSQITSRPDSNSLDSGAGVDDAFTLVRKYGYMSEATFIPEEIDDATSTRQRDAEVALKASLQDGALSTVAARKNPSIVRAELEKAWKLAPVVADQLTSVFGANYQWTFDNWGMKTEGTFVHRSSDLPVAWREYSRKTMRADTLESVLSRWTRNVYPTETGKRRAFQKRIQRALHDKNPVLIDWYVSWKQYDKQFTFEGVPGEKVVMPPGHVSYFADYEVDNVPGFGTLQAGTDETRAAALSGALADGAKVKFFRIKNSWGTDGNGAAPGFYDLHLSYLDGPITGCNEKEDKSFDDTKCTDVVPLQGVYLPYGY